MKDFLDLIIDNYVAAHSNPEKHKLFASDEWYEIYLMKKNKYMNKNNIKNFRSDTVSLDYGITDQSSKMDKIQNKAWSSHTLVELIQEYGYEFIFKNLNQKNVGNCENSHKIDGKFFDRYELFFINYYNDLLKNVFNSSKINTVVEIGGGYGVLARVILNNHNCKYISIDLPEQNLLQSYYLNESLPDLKKYLYNDYLNEKNDFISNESLENNQIFILPPWAKFQDNFKVDLFINTRSMMEMKFEIIKTYFDFIHKHLRENGYFYTINRYRGNLKYNFPNLVDYPYDNNWDVKLSKKAFKHNHMHVLLAKRVFNNFTNNIKDEMRKIREISEKHKIRFYDLSFSKDYKLNLRIKRFLIKLAVFVVKLFPVKLVRKIAKGLLSMSHTNR